MAVYNPQYRQISRQERGDDLRRAPRVATSAGPSRLATFIISPYALVLLSYVIMLVSISMPADWYEQIVNEKNFMEFDSNTFIFYTLSCASCSLGLWLWTVWVRPGQVSRQPVGSLYLLILVPIIALNAYSVLVILRNTPGLINLVLSGQGAVAKVTMDTTGALTGAQPLLIGAIFYAVGRHLGKYPRPGMPGAKFSMLMIVLAFFISVAISILKLARYEIMPLVIGIGVVYLTYSVQDGRFGVLGTIRRFSVYALGILGIFFFFSMLRGFANSDQLLLSLFGYGPASFNHLAILLDGGLNFPFGGTGTYAFTFLDQVPLLHNVIDFGAMFGVADTVQSLRSEFIATQEAGLNASFIWVTAPGYIYSDIGIFVFPYLVGIGALTGLFWRAMERRSAFGLVMYPFAAGTLAFWFSSNGMARPTIITYLGLALVLSAVEWLSIQFAAARRPGIYGPRG